MKNTDLMIGDYVRYIGCGYGDVKNGDIIKVESVQGRYIGVGNNAMADDELFEPIPLTAEILEKNGFDCSDEEVVRYNFTGGDYQGHFSLRRMYSGNTPNGWSFFAFNVLTIIDHVHELQHALRLCGIDKTIEL